MLAISFFITSLCVILVAYVYVGYPILLGVLSRIKSPKTVATADITPTVSFVISCYNEEQVLEAKINNSLAFDYPDNLIQIVVVSDGSDDATDDIAKRYSSKNVLLIRQEGRLGKTMGINMAIPYCEGEIIVFSDANAMYQPGAIKKLVRNFNDNQVGYVVGAAIYSDADTNASSKSEDSYWQYEMKIKKIESDICSVVGGDGAIYAIRKHLFEPLDAEDINDFVNPLQIIAKGYRGIFEPEAICFEETAADFRKEAKRKERIVNRSFRGLIKVKEVLNPLKYGFYSIQLISHKLLRWLVPFFITIGGIFSLPLAFNNSLFFQILILAGLALSWLAMIGHFKKNHDNLSSIYYYPYYFFLVNIYAARGIIEAVKGNIQITWSTPRENTSQNKSKDVDIHLACYFAASILLAASILFQLIS